MDVINTWGLECNLSILAMDNSADMINGVELLRTRLSGDTNGIYVNLSLHVRCEAHVINVVVKECMRLVKKCAIDPACT